MGVIYVNKPDPWGQAFSLAGMLLGQRQAERQQDKQKRAGYAMLDLATQDPQLFADTRIKTDAPVGFPGMGTQQPMQQADPYKLQVNPPSQPYPVQSNVQLKEPEYKQQPTITVPNRQNIQNKYKPQIAQAMKQATIAGYSPKEAYGMINQLVGQRVDDEYKQQQTAYFEDVLNKFVDIPNMDEKKAYKWALTMKSRGFDINPEQFASVYQAKKLIPLQLGNRVEMVDQTQPGTYEIGMSPGEQVRLAIAGGGDESGLSKEEQWQYNAAMANIKQFEGRWLHPQMGWMAGYEKDPRYQSYVQSTQIVGKFNDKLAKIGGGQQPTGEVNYNTAIQEITAALNKNAAAKSGERWSRQQFEDFIGQRYGGLAPQLINDVDWAAWGLGVQQNNTKKDWAKLLPWHTWSENGE